VTHDEFAALVARLEEKARRNPAAYKLRVIALALAGYGYLGLVLAFIAVLFLVALASVVYLKALGLKLAIVVGAFLWVVLRALWVKFSAPEGVEVRRKEAPALFATIDTLRRKLGSRRFHHVLVSNDFNASVVQVPRLGIFGWHGNYLIIGLPLMKSLTPGQLEAVLAHEFGHLAGGHGRLGNWIYRLRLSWYRLVHVLESQESFGVFLFKPFFGWYAPYFNAYSFPLARANEYEADAAAARLVSARAAAEALTNVEVIGSYLGERYWPEILGKADEIPHPAFAPFSSMGGRLSAGVEETDAQRWLERALAHQTNVDNTHPCLADRLKALGEKASLVPPAPGKAADQLLGGALARITAQFDAQWKENIAASWQERHRIVQEGRGRLAQLDALAAVTAEMPLDDALERARLTESFGAGAEPALEQFRRIHERAPENPGANFQLGYRLLARDDEAGFAMVERVLSLDLNAKAAACEVLRDYCWRMGRKDEAQAWHDMLAQATAILDGARKERATLLTTHKVERHGLPEEVIEPLRRQLLAIPNLRKAYLVRRKLKHLPEQPQYVLGFRSTPWWKIGGKKVRAEVQAKIVNTVVFPFDALIISVEGENYVFGRKFRFMRGTRIA
jgi:Zn-dependent protease with chaperone function